jgi:serine phosphatase RsbU (regulator of sigma subunit)
MFSEERLVEALHHHRRSHAREIHDTVLDRVREFQCGRPLDDDLTLILVKREASADLEEAGAGRNG